MTIHRFPLSILSIMALTAGCAASPANPEEVGTVHLAIAKVPSDAGCLRVSATAESTYTQAFDLIAGSSPTLAMLNVPARATTFEGQAFSGACSAVTETTRPTWVSDPVTATVIAYSSIHVSLKMHHSGETDVSVDWVSAPPTFAGATSATALDAASIKVGWAPASDDVTPTANIFYDVCWSTTPGACLGSAFTTKGTTTAGATSYTLTGLSAFTTYYIVVHARDVDGLHDSSSVQVSAQTLTATLGVPCATSAQCGSGHCVDGVCCNTACVGECQACDVGGATGTCQIIVGQPHGARPACIGVGVAPCGGSCIGQVACWYPTAVCRTTSCTGSTSTLPAFCGAGTCPTAASVSCAPYTCGATACKSTCTSNADCATDATCTAGVCKSTR